MKLCDLPQLEYTSHISWQKTEDQPLAIFGQDVCFCSEQSRRLFLSSKGLHEVEDMIIAYIIIANECTESAASLVQKTFCASSCLCSAISICKLCPFTPRHHIRYQDNQACNVMNKYEQITDGMCLLILAKEKLQRWFEIPWLSWGLRIFKVQPHAGDETPPEKCWTFAHGMEMCQTKASNVKWFWLQSQDRYG